MRKRHSERRQASTDGVLLFSTLRLPSVVRGVLRTYVAGEVIFDEDDNAEGVYIITTGSVRLIRRSCDRMLYAGEEHAPAAIATLGVLDGGRNVVTAVALSECTVEVLPGDWFDAVRCYSAPGLLIGKLTRLIRESTARLDLVCLMTVRQRIARMLLAASEAGPTQPIVLPCSQGQFALCLGTVREVLFRNLRQLQTDGVLAFDKRTVTILDPVALRRAAGRIGPAEHIHAGGASVWAPYLTDGGSMSRDARHV